MSRNPHFIIWLHLSIRWFAPDLSQLCRIKCPLNGAMLLECSARQRVYLSRFSMRSVGDSSSSETCPLNYGKKHTTPMERSSGVRGHDDKWMMCDNLCSLLPKDFGCQD